MTAAERRIDTQLIEDAHRTAKRLDHVTAELNGLVIELRSLLGQLAQIEERRQNG